MNLTFPELLQEHHFIGGEWVASDATYNVTDPSNGECLAKVARGGELETRRCIEAAHKALRGWRERTASDRSLVVRRWGELMVKHQRDLATLLTAEQGKPFAEAMGEVVYASNFLFWFAEEGCRIYGDIIPSHKPNTRIVVTKEPVGVVGAITPWNFPLAMITRKAGPALASGCTLIVKPSEETPLSALALAVLAERAGVTAGVFNVVSGDALAIGGALMRSKVVRKISFTGSTRTGKILMRQAADTVKRLSLELGGNAPFIVFDDADVDAAVEGAMRAKFRNTGQTCVCVNRFIVQDNIYESFTSKLATAANALKVANGFVAGAEQGPLINPGALAKVEGHVADALAKGATVLCGGRRHSAGGTFYEPTVLTDVNPEMSLANEETFGPVAACFRFETEDEAVQLANATESGLSAYFYTRNLGRAWRVAEALEVGMVGINEGIISTEVAPFGGVKESGLGREGSKYGIDEYLEIKYVLMGGLA